MGNHIAFTVDTSLCWLFNTVPLAQLGPSEMNSEGLLKGGRHRRQNMAVHVAPSLFTCAESGVSRWPGRSIQKGRRDWAAEKVTTLMSPVPVDQIAGGGDGHGFGITTHMNLLFQLITTCHLLQHLFTLRFRKTSSSSAFSFLPSRSSHSQASTSLLLGIFTLGALVAYILGIRPLQGDVHFLTLTSRTPHPRAQPLSITEDYYNLHQRLYDLALVCIYASAVIQLSTGRNVIMKMDRDNIDAGRNHHHHQDRYTRAPQWAVVLIGVAGAVALAVMRSPLLEAFLGGDFDKTRRLSGASALIAFLLVLWRFVTFLDIISTVYSLRNQEHKDAAVLALWQRASLPMAAELSFDVISILFYERATLRPFTSDDDGNNAAIHIFDSPLAIALTALTLALAKVLVERNNAQSTSTSSSNSTLGNAEFERDGHRAIPLPLISSR